MQTTDTELDWLASSQVTLAPSLAPHILGYEDVKPVKGTVVSECIVINTR